MKSGQWELKTSKLRTRTERIVIDERVVGYKDILAKGVREIEFERMREKGIDVKLATDIVVAAVDDKYDTAIVVSSDTDLTPALDWVRKRRKKRIEYVGFSIPDQDPNVWGTRPSQALITYSDVQRTLITSDLKPFILAIEQG